MEKKKIYCIGDSLTEGDYGVAGKSGIGNVKPENYPRFLSELSGCPVVNCGRCGATAQSYLEFLRSGSLSLGDAEVIVIMLGTNGSMSLSEGNADYMAYLEIIDYCKESAPGARLVLCAPPHATENPAYSNCGYMQKIVPAAEAVRQVAKERELPLIDVFAYPEICEENTSKYQSADGLHFNEAGYRLLAQFIFSELTAKGIL